MTRTVGMIGCSPDNGHPFSFSAIVNGYDPYHLDRSEWPQIYRYVHMRDRSEFGFPNVRITHAWTPDPATTERLCNACRIPHRVDRAEEMADKVDAVIIARDDADSHYRLAMPCLRAGLPVFVDKPLTLRTDELDQFRPYLSNGQLMSCSGMRFARELDEIRSGWKSFGRVRLVRGTIVNGWERYGVHLLEAIFSLPLPRPDSVQALDTRHDSFSVKCGDTSVQIDALGDVPPVFKLEIYGARKHVAVEIVDNFTMFRRMLWHFFRMCDTGTPAVPADTTLMIMSLLRAGIRSKTTGRRVGRI